jgi:aspartokinase-like uncharacterized kinase
MTPGWQFGMIRGAQDTRPSTSRVVKIGGSLLSNPHWPGALQSLLISITQPLIVVGGGSIVDGLRAIDAANPRPAQLMHELAIEAMTLTARLVADALGLPLVASPRATGPAVLDVFEWLATATGPPALPASWDVTSDSLAAAAAVACSRPLILVKSTPPPITETTLQGLAASGWIDAYFQTAAAPLTTIAWAVLKKPS